MVLVARRFKRRPTEYTAASAFQVRVDDKGGNWSISEIEKRVKGELKPGLRLTHEKGDFQYRQAEGQKLRLEGELVKLARHHNGLKKAVSERTADIHNLTVESEDIRRLLDGMREQSKKDKSEPDLQNLEAKLQANEDRQGEAKKALEYWKNELDTYQPAVDSLTEQIENCVSIMNERTVQEWEFLAEEPTRIVVAD